MGLNTISKEFGEWGLSLIPNPHIYLIILIYFFLMSKIKTKTSNIQFFYFL